MAEVTEERFCPLCENIVPREQKGILVVISPARRVLLHEGCAEKVYVAVSRGGIINSKEEKGEEEDD